MREISAQFSVVQWLNTHVSTRVDGKAFLTPSAGLVRFSDWQLPFPPTLKSHRARKKGVGNPCSSCSSHPIDDQRRSDLLVLLDSLDSSRKKEIRDTKSIDHVGEDTIVCFGTGM